MGGLVRSASLARALETLLSLQRRAHWLRSFRIEGGWCSVARANQSSTPILLPRTQPFWLEVRSSARLDPTEAGRAAAPDASPTPRRPPCRIRRPLKTIPSRWQFGQMGRAEGSSGSPRRGCIRTRTARGGAMLAVVRRCANRILYAKITDEEFGIGATGTASSMDLVSS